MGRRGVISRAGCDVVGCMCMKLSMALESGHDTSTAV